MLSSNHICHINIFSYFSQKGFKGVFPMIYPHFSLFLPQGFQEVIPLFPRPQEQIDQGGVLGRN
jgi:hypothetical protein